MAMFEIYKDAKAEWRWRLVAPNGRTIADSGEGYNRPSGAQKAVERLKELAPGARIVRPV
jgi:uncharacterized protein